MRVSVITVSDSSHAGTRVDESGPKLVELVDQSLKVNATVNLGSPTVVPDDVKEIRKALLEKCKDSDVIITTGGTGFSKRDVTPEVQYSSRHIYLFISSSILGNTRSYRKTLQWNGDCNAHWIP
ncbi:hypothetical protein B9Z55_019855 [Caenorhabditis nigoni]|uniref:molybdopterin molybdotransferase n=1 Tax=Caenorhabditis nigoni TaxID=1611254 RepID=A0A2G5TK58_9PELO|nr:hypothetical protein B9Z55_019855 [Caenorhabditis nigoni]